MAERTPEEEAQAQREREAAATQRRRERAAEREGDEEPTYHVDRLLEDSHAFFGQPRSVLVGALRLAGGNKKNYTIAESREAIDAYLGHEDSSRAGEER